MKAKVKFDSCPRCHKPHDCKMKVKKFDNPMIFQGDVSIPYWGLCPTTKDPILFYGYPDVRFLKWTVFVEEKTLRILDIALSTMDEEEES